MFHGFFMAIRTGTPYKKAIKQFSIPRKQWIFQSNENPVKRMPWNNHDLYKIRVLSRPWNLPKTMAFFMSVSWFLNHEIPIV